MSLDVFLQLKSPETEVAPAGSKNSNANDPERVAHPSASNFMPKERLGEKAAGIEIEPRKW